MPIRFVCPQCGRAGRLPDDFPGGKIRCPACKTISQVEGGGIAGSNLTSEATPAEQAVPAPVGHPMPGGDTYEVEEAELRPEIKTPLRTSAVPPIPKETRKESRKKEKPSRRPIAWIAGAAVAGAAVVTGFLIFLLRPSGVAERPAAAQVREGGADDATAQRPGNVPQPSVPTAPVTGQIAEVADPQGNPGDTQPGTSRPSPTGTALGNGPQGTQTNRRMLGSAPRRRVASPLAKVQPKRTLPSRRIKARTRRLTRSRGYKRQPSS